MVRRRAHHKGSRGKNQPGRVRIIGGRWRGTRLPVVDVPGLRPSGDRLRETLFNWLLPVLPGARCLDLFAGTGVLGLEAVSRGAARAVLVERDSTACASLMETVNRLDAGDAVQVVQADADAWLASAAECFDLVFLDPPFDSGLDPSLMATLAERLAPGARIYLEAPSQARPPLPPAWTIDRHRQFGEVQVWLLTAGA